MNLLKLHESGTVLRWHTWPTIKEQNLAAHSWGVAMICAQLAPGEADLITAALVHDLHEVEAGDVPYPFKQNNAFVGRAYDEQQLQFNETNGCNIVLDERQQRILKWADMFELLLFARREYHIGNTKILWNSYERR